MYLVEGLEDSRFALVAKSHLCLVDGIDNVEIGQVLLDSTARAQAIPAAGVDADSWQPVPEPSSLELLAGALLESAQDPDDGPAERARGVGWRSRYGCRRR